MSGMRRAVEALDPALLAGIPEDGIHTLKVEENGAHGGLDVYIGYAVEHDGTSRVFTLELRERRGIVDLRGGGKTDYEDVEA